MKWLSGIVPVLLFAACSPPTALTPPPQMSAEARATMEQVNSADDFSGLADVPAIPASAVPQDVTIAQANGPTDTVTVQNNANAPEQTEAMPPAEAKFNATMVRIEVALDRAHFSPGVIDGFNGDNVRKAVSAYQAAHNVPVTGVADAHARCAGPRRRAGLASSAQGRQCATRARAKCAAGDAVLRIRTVHNTCHPGRWRRA
ncbi:MAG: peptidoglycan-binding protein [Terricaulis sp.]